MMDPTLLLGSSFNEPHFYFSRKPDASGANRRLHYSREALPTGCIVYRLQPQSRRLDHTRGRIPMTKKGKTEMHNGTEK